jgi:hypothetical protein
VLIVDSLIISGVKFVLTRLAAAVEAEMYDETHLREELLAAQMKLELGEITDHEFAEVEDQILAGLREIGERKRGMAPDGKSGKKSDAPRTYSIESVSAEFGHREEPDD